MKPNYLLKKEAKDLLDKNRKNFVLLSLVPLIINDLSIIFLIFDYFSDREDLFDLARNFKWSFSTFVPNFFMLTEKHILLTIFSLFAPLLSSFFVVWIMWLALSLKRQEFIRLAKANLQQASPMNHFSFFLFGTILQRIFLSLWTTLVVIPGIIKHYSYAMTYFILKEKQTLTVDEAITKSRKLMHGNKMRLFLLDLSFLPWHFLEIITLGIAYAWILPYITATKAVFYDDLLKKYNQK